jgi:MFS family permease
MQMTLLAGFLGWMMDGYEQAIFPLLANPALGSMMPADQVGSWMSFITAAFLLGAALGGSFFGWLGDRVGRVKAMSLSILFYSLFSGLCAFATLPEHFLVCRFLAALGMGGEWALGVALVMEVWPEDKRPLMAGSIGAAANVGMIVVGLVGVFYPVTGDSWKHHFLIGASPAILTFLIRFFVPESERWKRSVGESAVAKPSIRELFEPQLRSATLGGVLLSSIVIIGTWGAVQWNPVWVESLAKESGAFIGKDVYLPKAYALIAVSVGAAIGAFFSPLWLRRLPRRVGFAILCLLSLAACQWLYRADAQWGSLLLFKIFLQGFTTASFFGFFPLYLPELFPTRIRATGQGFCYNSGRIVAIPFVLLAPVIVSFFGDSSAGTAHRYQQSAANMTLVYAFGLIAVLAAKETVGQPLRD